MDVFVFGSSSSSIGKVRWVIIHVFHISNFGGFSGDFFQLVNTFLVPLSTYFARFVHFIVIYIVHMVFSDFISKMQQKIDHWKVHLLAQFHLKNVTNSSVSYFVLLVSFENCIICLCSKGNSTSVK